MPRWNGGVIGAANNPTSSSAKGIWSLSEATKAIRAGLWPPSNAGADPYFENVTLLLPGNGTNGAQNNTFLDSSTNNFTITRNGNTTQGTFTPFSKADGRWSNYFDGNGDYLTTPNNSALTLGTNNFTIEMWVYCPNTATGALQILYDQRSSGSQAVPTLFLDVNGTLNYYVSGSNRITSASAVSSNAWNHIAVERSSGTTKMYVNGAQVGSSYSDSTTYVGNSVGIGAYLGSPSLYFSGYISSLRVVNGTAVYSGTSFNVPTTPLTNITNTSLLTCQSNRFIDNSTNAFAITRNGDVAVTTFSPFPTMTAYAAGTNGGSGYFDGSGDYLSIAANTALDVGSGDFSIDVFAYPLSKTNTNDAVFGYGALTMMLFHNNTNWTFEMSNNGSSNQVAINFSVTLNAWQYIAVRKSGTNVTVYKDGVSVGTGTISGSVNTSSKTLEIGRNGSFATQSFTGYIGDFRLVKGTSLASYSVPTAPLTAVSGTSILTNFTNGGIIDTSMSNDLETVGNAQISTTQSKFGGGSMSFDGTGDALVVYDPSYENSPGGGDFTFECWVYFNALPGAFSAIYHLKNDASTSTTVFIVEISSTGKLSLSTGIATIIDGTAGLLTTGSWIHIAVTRASGTLRTFVNGTQDKSASNTTTYNGSYDLFGVWRYSGSDNYLNAYIDDLRITKGYARYTANFTPPTGPFVGFGD